MKPSKARIRMAKKLMNRIRYFLKNEEVNVCPIVS